MKARVPSNNENAAGYDDSECLNKTMEKQIVVVNGQIKSAQNQ